MSEKCIIYRPLKHQKRLKTRVETKLSVDARTLETSTSPLSLELILISIFVILFFLFKTHA